MPHVYSGDATEGVGCAITELSRAFSLGMFACSSVSRTIRFWRQDGSSHNQENDTILSGELTACLISSSGNMRPFAQRPIVVSGRFTSSAVVVEPRPEHPGSTTLVQTRVAAVQQGNMAVICIIFISFRTHECCEVFSRSAPFYSHSMYKSKSFSSLRRRLIKND